MQEQGLGVQDALEGIHNSIGEYPLLAWILHRANPTIRRRICRVT